MSDIEKEFSPPYGIIDNEDSSDLSDLGQNGYLNGMNIAPQVSIGTQVLNENNGVLLPQGLDWKEVAEEAFEESEGDAEPIIDKGEMVEQDDDLITSPNSSNFSFDDAAEIDGISNFNIVIDFPELNYKASDIFEFEGEINDWFGSQDLKDMKMMKSIYELTVKPVGNIYLDFNNLSTSQKVSLMVSLSENANAEDITTRLKAMISLCYIVMGGFGNIIDHEDHLQNVFENSLLFLEPTVAFAEDNRELIIDHVLEALKFSMTELSDIRKFYKEGPPPVLLKKLSNILFYSMTIVYICVIVILVPKESDILDENTEKLQTVIEKTDLLAHITKSIDSWRWLANESEEKDINSQSNRSGGITKLPTNRNAQLFKFRNVVLLLWKLLVLQFGNDTKRSSTKSFLKFKYEDQKKFSSSVANSNGGSFKSTNIISPTDYHHFRNGLIARYPSYTPPKYEISHISEMILEENEDENNTDDLGTSGVFNGSISRRLSTASSSLLLNQQHSFKQKPPFNDKPPEIHIATPVPSPTLTPQHTGNSSRHTSKVPEVDGMNAKGRKVFMTHPSYPHIYPLNLDDTKSNMDVPYSIKEAAMLFYENVREDFNTKQFLSVFEQFIKDENGMNLLPENDSGNDFKYDDKDLEENPMFVDEIKSLQRVENYYEKCLPYLNSLVVVLLQILASNIFENNHDDLLKQVSGESPPSDDFRKTKSYKQLDEFGKQKLELVRIKETSLKGASSILFVLLKWFKLSHFLKFEYFASLIFDNDFYVHLFQFLGSNQLNTELGDSLDYNDPQNLMINRMVFCDYEILYDHADYNFFKMALSVSTAPGKSSYTTNFGDLSSIIDEKQTVQQYNVYAPPFVGQSKLSVRKPNWRYCLILNNLFRTLYMTISKTKSQRIYRLLEIRPTENLRFHLTLYNESLYRPILKIVKAISPFNGKKWRSNNMDLISFVYLFYKVGLKDHWLTNFFTVNLNERLKKSWDHEYALRSLLLFYNVKNYGEEMVKLGHHVKIEEDQEDYFSDELQRLIGEEIEQQQQQPNAL